MDRADARACARAAAPHRRGRVQQSARAGAGARLSRERISKILGLLFLAPGIQEEILFLAFVPGEQPLNEADLHRTVLRAVEWQEQWEVWGRVVQGESPQPATGPQPESC